MKVLYLDCFSGISGDMTVGALVDLGAKPSTLEWELSKLQISDFHLHFEREQRQNISGIKFTVHEGATHRHGQDEPAEETHAFHEGHHHHGHGHGEAHDHDDEEEGLGCDHDHGAEIHIHHHEEGRSHRAIRELIEHSELSSFVKEHALGIFQRIAQAEGKIHGVSPEEVCFHEVGALDSIADIVCTCVAIESLGVEKVLVSRLVEGHGTIRCAHGTFPVPTPATLEILRGIPLGQVDEPHELITPTGAGILAEFGAAFGLMPEISVQKVGYGLGTRKLVSRPNVLRAVFGDLAGE